MITLAALGEELRPLESQVHIDLADIDRAFLSREKAVCQEFFGTIKLVGFCQQLNQTEHKRLGSSRQIGEAGERSNAIGEGQTSLLHRFLKAKVNIYIIRVIAHAF